MNMDFEQLLKQEVQKAARQDYEEITALILSLPIIFYFTAKISPLFLKKFPAY